MRSAEKRQLVAFCLFCLALPFLIDGAFGWRAVRQTFACDGVAAIDSDDAPAKRPSRKKVQRLEDEDAVKRGYARAREVDDPKVLRFQVVRQPDDVGTGVLCVAEFDNGDLGLYWASKADDAKDQWIYVSKPNLAQLRESINRLTGSVGELR